MSDPNERILSVLETQLAPENVVQLAMYRKELESFTKEPLKALAFMSFIARPGQAERMRDAITPLLDELANKLGVETECVCPACIIRGLEKKEAEEAAAGEPEVKKPSTTANRTVH